MVASIGAGLVGVIIVAMIIYLGCFNSRTPRFSAGKSKSENATSSNLKNESALGERSNGGGTMKRGNFKNFVDILHYRVSPQNGSVIYQVLCIHPVLTLGQKSTFHPKIHTLKIPTFTKIHLSEISLFTKFTFLKSHFSQNSHF